MSARRLTRARLFGQDFLSFLNPTYIVAFILGIAAGVMVGGN
jgi:hypothetical protein